MMQRRGFTLIEVIVASLISITVLAVGYSLYAGVLRTQDLADQRESVMLTVQNTMSQIKRDVRSAASVGGDHGTLTIDGGRIRYKSLPGGDGVERIILPRGSRIYKGVSAEFVPGSNGVSVTLRSNARVQRRPIRIEITSFIFPRNS